MSIKIDKLIRSKRRTLCLEINQKAQLVVRAPMRISEQSIYSFINEKEGWIRKKQLETKNKFLRLKPKKFIEGENFLFLGSEFELKFVENQKKFLVFDQCFKLSKSSVLNQNIKDIFEKWYKKEARVRITESVKLYSKIADLKYEKIRITSAQTRWGSCSGKNTLSFTWRLVMAPMGVLDYVVVHELAHIKHKNHSKKFWDFVEQIFPDYKNYKKWIKENGYLLKL